MYSQSNDQELRKEATVAPEGSQDQNSQPSNPDTGKEKKGTRNPYDGSKDHGVVPAKLVTIEAAKNAKARLQLRQTFLNAQYEKFASITEKKELSMSDRIPAAKEAEKINTQLTKLQSVSEALNARIPELEEKEQDVVLNFNRAKKVDFTI